MMYCRRCGAEIYDDAYTCPYCGILQPVEESDGMKVIWAILGLITPFIMLPILPPVPYILTCMVIIPVFEVFLYMYWRQTRPKTARMAAIGGVLSFIIGMALFSTMVMIADWILIAS